MSLVGCWGTYDVGGSLLGFEAAAVGHSSEANGACSRLRVVWCGEEQRLVGSLLLQAPRKRLRCDAQLLFVDAEEWQSDAAALPTVLLHMERIAAQNSLRKVVPLQPELLGTSWEVSSASSLPCVPRDVLRGKVLLRVATAADRKEWSQLVLHSCSHNLGGREMVSATWDAEFRAFAVDAASGRVVGLVSAGRSGWVPYLTSFGCEGQGLGAFLLFVGLEWLRLCGVRRASLSPSDRSLLPWYTRWGFAFSRHVGVHDNVSDLVMSRRIDALQPLLPKPLSHYVCNLSLPLCEDPYVCLVCERVMHTDSSFRRHLSQHNSDAALTSDVKRLCCLVADCNGWTWCSHKMLFLEQGACRVCGCEGSEAMQPAPDA